MRIIQTIISYFAIASALLASLFSFGEPVLKPYSNEYQIPESLPAYSTISTDEKTDWTAKWIWDQENLTEENVWMCFHKKVSLSSVPDSLTANISADSKYWLFINGASVVFEGSLKRGPAPGSGCAGTRCRR